MGTPRNGPSGSVGSFTAGAIEALVDHRVECRVPLLDARDRGVNELDRCDLSGSNQRGLRSRVEEREVIHRLDASVRLVGPAPELRTERLLLRRWIPTDVEPYAALNADPEVREHFPNTLTRGESEAEIARFEARFDERGYGLWAVEVPGVASCIGYVGLDLATFDAPFTPAVEVGWRLARDHWGKGYASEGARAALRFGFDTVGLDEIVSFTTTGNVRSRSVMERIGMTRDPAFDFEHPNVAVGHRVRPHVLYRVSRTTSDASLSSRRPL